MGDLRDPRLMYMKAGLFVLIGLLSGLGLLLEHPRLRTALLLGVCVWACCRAYYFAFYVIEHWIDPGYRYAGLWHFLRRRLGRARDPG
ncbi:MAG: hypothetical protein IPJ41_09735 [Phycisphaerales bacterium]|nr:hypothetical protein [Phycisphaerales bacterium]